jgi:hypothetical protein
MRCQPNTDKVSVSDKVRLSQGQFGNCALKGDIYFGLAKNIPFSYLLSLSWLENFFLSLSSSPSRPLSSSSPSNLFTLHGK